MSLICMLHPVSLLPQRWVAVAGIQYLVVGLLCCCGLTVTRAQETVDAEKALRSIGNPKWYDKQEDGYRKPKVSESKDNSIREDGWEAKRAANSSSSTMGSAKGAGGGGWNGLNADAISAVFLTVLGVLLTVVLGLLLFYAFRSYVPSTTRKRDQDESIEIDPAKVSELPFEANQAEYGNPLEQAAAFMREGRYREAMIFLYGYQLLALDQARKIELQRGKTNRMYLKELKKIPTLRTIVEGTMLGFEDAFFGDHAISKARFLECWDRMNEFHDLAKGSTQPPPQAIPEQEVALS